jgi:PTS system mannose-specific IID component
LGGGVVKGGFVSAALRLLVIQGSMNNERLQGLGAAVAIEPLIRDLDGGRGGETYRAALARSAGFFNTNPYLAGLAIGAVAQAEHSNTPAPQVERLRSALRGPLGSLGDRLMWTGVLPASASVGLICATFTGPFVAAGVFLALFNTVNGVVRWWSLRAGWESGVAVAKAMNHPFLQGGVRLVGPLASLGIGLALPIVAEWLTVGLDAAARWSTAAIGAATVVVAWWLIPSMGAARLGILVSSVIIVLGWIW